MRKIKFVLFIAVIFLNLSCAKKEEKAIVIGKIKISQKEFQNAFKKSVYTQTPAKGARKEFLENFINRKLILKEAEELGLDKDSQFLDNVQAFWEQSLLKLVLDKKIKELSLGLRVDDKEIRQFYETNKSEFPDKEESQVYDQIKLLIFKEKQGKAIQGWIDSLRKKREVKINYKLLNLQ